ncbi:MAG: cytochrome C oxidase subunit IV family protein [Blastocatellia bacterium]|nr:cytochrome C oxidase subunit IV family protein [Blastocatellia bacterium]
MSEHHAEHNAHTEHHHVSPVNLYWTVWGGLMVLTVITVLAYYIPIRLNLNLGAANVIIAMVIATTKATLVCMYFMHLKYDKKFNLIAFLSSLIFLGLFLSFTLLDINTREDAQPFAKPLYSGKELPLEGGHSAGATPAETKTESSATSSPAASPVAGEMKKEEAKPSASAASAGAAKH